jgi:hypothetical protein
VGKNKVLFDRIRIRIAKRFIAVVEKAAHEYSIVEVNLHLRELQVPS